MTYRVDEIDKRILYHLAADARGTSAPMIAEEVDVTPATVRHRIRQLEEQGIIQGYHADIDYEAIDGKVTTQFTCTAPVEELSRLVSEAGTIPGVVNVRELMAGQRNLVVTAVGSDTDDVARITQTLSNLGLTIEREDIVRDEQFHPYQPFNPESGQSRTNLTDFQSLAGGAELLELTVSEDAKITGNTLAEANQEGLLPDDILVVSIERGDRQITPDGSTTIEAGDVVSLFSRESLPEDIKHSFEAEAVG